MSTIIEMLLILAVAGATTRVVMSVRRRRAAERSAQLRDGNRVEIPCRITWKQGTGSRGSVYGKLTAAPDGGQVLFVRPMRSAVPVPAGRIAQTANSWRAGNTDLLYRTLDGQEIRIMTSAPDTKAVTALLGRPGTSTGGTK
ncbi:hypothetical protein ACFWXK_13720 [Streptomyces sp. NPDC059070]|uniref:hypothetical protein n=1 Tax=Streptomyces sp. NPDC059070 TaxID=3346713 RepID=UPI0036C731D9